MLEGSGSCLVQEAGNAGETEGSKCVGASGDVGNVENTGINGHAVVEEVGESGALGGEVMTVSSSSEGREWSPAATRCMDAR